MSAPALLALNEPPGCCEDETWLPMPDWPSHEVSTCSRIRSVDRLGDDGIWRLGRMLPQHEDNRKGYVYAVLLDGKRRRKVHVAVAVLEAHRGLRPGPGYDACHGNHVRTENHLWNLSWDTHAANVAASAQCRRAAVTDIRPVTVTLSQGGCFPRSRLTRHLSRVSVTSARSSDTGSHPVPFTFPSAFTPVQPLVRALRTSFRSLRNRGAA